MGRWRLMVDARENARSAEDSGWDLSFARCLGGDFTRGLSASASI